MLPEVDAASDTETNMDSDAGIQRDMDIFPAAVPVGADTGVERSNSGAYTMVDRASQTGPQAALQAVPRGGSVFASPLHVWRAYWPTLRSEAL